MWGMFAAAVLLGAAFLYVPGYFMMRALRFSRIPSFACAPLLSVVLYGVMTVAYEKLGVFCDWVSLAVPALIIGVAAFVVSQMLTARFSWRGVSSSLGSRSGSVFGMRADRFDLLCLVAYIVVGAAAVCVVLLANLEAPDSVLQEYDNIHHLGQIHAFVSSGVWSPLSVTLFPGADAAADADVRSALGSVGADYVLVLDDERVTADRAYLFTYDPALWQGILSIDADTPGFELVLSEGDMRLYRITAAA